jgi:branched-subunit amino acid transport protein AzlD
MPRDFVRTTLRERHRPIVRALAEAMFSDATTTAKSRLDAFVDDVDDFVSHASRMLRFGLLLMLEVIHFTPLVLLWRFATFESLPCPDRVRVLERMESSRIVGFTLVLAAYKAILCLIYFEHPDELAAIGYTAERTRWVRALPMALSEAAE